MEPCGCVGERLQSRSAGKRDKWGQSLCADKHGVLSRPRRRGGRRGEEAQGPAPELWAPEGGAPWPQALDTVGNPAPENAPGLGKDPGLA